MNDQDLKVSVIICAYTMGRLKDIREAIDSVMAQTPKPYELIIAVDHNEELFQRLKAELSSEVKVVLNRGAQGLSETRNVGIRAATGGIAAFLDDDAVADKDWLYNLKRNFNFPNIMAVGGRVIPIWLNGKRPFWFPDEFDFIIGCTAHKKLIMQENNQVRNVTGSNMAFRNEVFRRAGFWDNGLGAIKGNPRGGEEADICLRIKAAVIPSLILYEPKAVVSHKIQPSRARLKYVFDYCLRDGLAKAKMKKKSSRFVDRPLATEKVFLRRLLFISLPQRLRRFYRLVDLAQAGMIIANVLIIGAGYLLGRFKYR